MLLTVKRCSREKEGSERECSRVKKGEIQSAFRRIWLLYAVSKPFSDLSQKPYKINFSCHHQHCISGINPFFLRK